MDANGCETPLNTLTNCGGCGVSCSRANASATCGTRMCRIATCNSGFGNCDSMDANGCENTLDSLENCGACGTICALANADESCAGDVCRITSCTAPFDDCNGNDADGCERNLNTNNNHCGGCGLRCGDHASCNGSGSCVCDSGFFDCNGDIGTPSSDGCETANSVSNCGGCGIACGAGEGCTGAGRCTCGSTVGTAATGEACVGAANECCSDVCRDTDTSRFHCGGCGALCDLPGTFEECSGGSCVPASCTSGTADCNMDGTDGCETSLGTMSNCSGCGDVCSVTRGTPQCFMGGCRIDSCDANFDDCDGFYGNGCETNLLFDNNNCGFCGNACGGAAICDTGTCA
jgi:hypothetical protein